MKKTATTKKATKKTATKPASTGLTIAQKKDWAKTLYLQDQLSQKEISAKVGVNENTMTKWVNENEREWDKLRKSLLTSKQELLRNCYDILDNISKKIKEGDGIGDSKLADMYSKYTAAIRNLETETGIATVAEVARLFINWLQTLDMQLAFTVTMHFDAFIKERLKKF